MTVRQALEQLNNLIDESDPDTTLPNIVHAFQTAERARREYPEHEWLHLTGLIHDLGKIMAFYGEFLYDVHSKEFSYAHMTSVGEPQYAVVGDTFVVGCEWSENIVYRDESFEGNPDGRNPEYNTKYGIYTPNCGLENLLMSWGHDEYMYRVLKHNGSTLPQHALNIIRFHSFYPWHSAGDYEHLMKPDDNETKKWVLIFK
jgi:inositol oxygenase